MPREDDTASIALTPIRGVLVATLPPDLEATRFDHLRQRVLQAVAGNTVRALVLDFSAVDLLGLTEFERARALLRAARLLGTAGAMVSLSPALVLYLTEVQADTAGVTFFFGLDEALEHFTAAPPA